MRRIVFAMMAVMLLGSCLSGCAPQVLKGSEKPRKAENGPFKPEGPDKPEPEVKGISVEASTKGTLNENMLFVLGEAGTLTWESADGQPHVIETGGSKVTLTSGTKIKFGFSESGGMFTFVEPRPSAAVDAGLVKLKAPLVSVLFKPDGMNAEATADVGFGIKKRVPFRLDFSSPESSGAPPEPKAEAPRKRPVVYCYTTPGCGPCEQAKREIRAAGDLGFDVIFTDNGPAWATARPWFHFSTPNGWMRATNAGWMGVGNLKRLVESNQTAPRMAQPPQARSSRISPMGPLWTFHGGDTKSELIEHLLDDGIHRGRYSRGYLNSLSRDQLVALHSRDHNTAGRRN